MFSEKIMDDISSEIEKALKALKKAKTPEERLIYSKVVKNLCQSLGGFLNLAKEMMASYLEEGPEGEAGPFKF